MDVNTMLQTGCYNGGMSRSKPDSTAIEQEISGHSRFLRQRLKVAREGLGLSQREVAERIADRIGRPFTHAAVSAWENFVRHPAVDVMAAWARVVGLRLFVDLDKSDSKRVLALLEPKTAELAAKLNRLDDDDLQQVDAMVNRFLKPK